MAEQARARRREEPVQMIPIPSRAQEERPPITMREEREQQLPEGLRHRLRDRLLEERLPPQVADAISGFLYWETLNPGYRSLELKIQRGALEEDDMRKVVRAFTRVFGETHEVERRGSTIRLHARRPGAWEEPVAVEVEAVARPRRREAREEEHEITGEEARTRQVLRALETGEYSGITYPGARGTRADFFGQFTPEEMRYITLAWSMATQKEKELFAAELDAYFDRAGPGRIGMQTLVSILKRMAQDSASQRRYISLTDVYYYAVDVMAEERVAGTERESHIGDIGRHMERKIGRRYSRLVTELEEARRRGIIREISFGEVVPAPAAEAAAPAEAAPAVRPERSDVERIRTDYVVVQNTLGVLREEEIRPQEAERMRASITNIENRILASIEALDPASRRQVEWMRTAILDRRSAEARLAERVPVVVEEAAPAPAEAVRYDYNWAMQQLNRVDELLKGTGQAPTPRFDNALSVADAGVREQIRAIYLDLLGRIDAIIEATADVTQKNDLVLIRDAARTALSPA
ncbi:MAG: hypothetical protein AB1657_06195 [Candidatus Micrarchaeota archaeon]